VVSEFGRLFVRTHRVDHVHLAALSRALNDRLLAEYDEELTFSAEQAEAVRTSATVFVEMVRRLIDAPETETNDHGVLAGGQLHDTGASGAMVAPS
jgi:uncharacterized protein (UPF0332 family)